MLLLRAACSAAAWLTFLGHEWMATKQKACSASQRAEAADLTASQLLNLLLQGHQNQPVGNNKSQLATCKGSSCLLHPTGTFGALD